jgi:hypothetical protein
MKKMDVLTLDDLTINPFLVGTLHLETPEEIVEFFVNQRFQRGVVTAFGTLLEKRITKLFAESADVADIDLKFKKNGESYYMQMKSGPEGFTGPALKKTIETMRKLKKANPDVKTVIAFAYGTKDKISKVWGSDLDRAVEEGTVDKVLLGREFWTFVLDDPNGYKLIFELTRKAGIVETSTLTGERRSLEKARRDAISRILKQFKQKYGEGPEAVSKMMENSL